MKILKNKKGVTKSLVGGIVGGAGNALYDKYVSPHLPTSVQGYEDYVKVGLGILLPMVSRNEYVQGVGNGLLTIGCSKIVDDLLAKAGNDSGSGIYGVANPATAMVGRIRRPFSASQYRRRSRVAGLSDPATEMVAGVPVC